MNVIRMLVLAIAVLLPTSWTLANAGDDMKEGSDGEMKKGKNKKKGDMGGEMDKDKKKGDMEKK